MTPHSGVSDTGFKRKKKTPVSDTPEWVSSLMQSGELTPGCLGAGAVRRNLAAESFAHIPISSGEAVTKIQHVNLIKVGQLTRLFTVSDLFLAVSDHFFP